MPDPSSASRRPRLRDLAVGIVLVAWIVTVARTERAPSPTPPVVSYAATPR